MVRIKVEIDLDADAAYIELAPGTVVDTRAVNDQVNVDLDEHGVVLGIETLRVNAEIPFFDLETRFHVRSEVIEALRRIRPSPAGFVAAFSSASDAGSTATRLSQVESVAV